MIDHWSQDLQQQTLGALRKVPAFPDGKLHMKHKSEGYGHFDLIELTASRFILRRKGGGAPLIFADEQAVVAAGWVID